MFFTDVQITTRARTRDGMLRAKAILTRAGDFEYDAKELGLKDVTGRVILERPVTTLTDPETLRTVRGAPLTIDHPADNVTPGNWKKVVVGNVVGEPEIRGDHLYADLLIGDQTAIDELESGKKELSLGYAFPVERISRNGVKYRLDSGLVINHVAIVEAGRAGPGVRVLDKQKGDSTMTEEQVKQVATDAAKSVLDSLRQNGTTQLDANVLTDAISKVVKPLSDQMAEITKSQADAQKAADQAEAEKKAKEAADALVKKTRDEERSRFTVLQNVQPLLSDEQKKTVADKSVKEILVEALKDHVTDAANKDEGYLTGALDMALAAVKNAGTSGSNGIGRPGITVADQGGDAYKNYVNSLKDAHVSESQRQKA